MAEAGAHTILNGRDRKVLENNVQMLSESYLQAEAIVLDASDTAAVTQWVAEQAPVVDILVNNIGPRTRRPIAELMPQDFRDMLDGGLLAVIEFCHESCNCCGRGSNFCTATFKRSGPASRRGQ